MTSSPVYIKGKYLLAKSKVPKVKKSALLEFFKNELIQKYRSQIWVNGNRIKFQNRSFLGTSFRCGVIKVVEEDDHMAICYSLNMSFVILLSLVFAVVTWLILFFITPPAHYLLPSVGAAAVGLVFFTVIHLITNIAFNHFMRQKVKRVQDFAHKLAA